MITIDEFKKGEISAGKILSVEIVEGSDKLLKLSVDFGEERPRTVVSGIRKYFADLPAGEAGPHPLVGVTCAFATNLEPRPLMGLVSEAMILAMSTGSTSSPQAEPVFSLLRIDDVVPPGTKAK